MTGTSRPWPERALLRRAWELVVARLGGEDVAWDADFSDGMPADEAEAIATVEALDPLDVLARAHAIVSREWIAGFELPRRHKCGWCVSAAIAAGAGERAAWAAAEVFGDLAAVQRHTVSCEHNPLVARLREFEAAWSRGPG